MRWKLELMLNLAINTMCLHILTSCSFDCWCDDSALCKPISASHQVRVEVSYELFAFHGDNEHWTQYDWSKITTIAVSYNLQLDMLCAAHAENVRVVLNEDLGLLLTMGKDDQTDWIISMGDHIQSVFMDGINMNLNNALAQGSDHYNKVTQLISQLIAYFHKELPGYQISFSVPWTPKCKSKRCIDFLAISRMCDLFFVESFNIPNDMKDGCVATTSSSYHNVLTGLSDYIKLGIDSRKLVMGVRWYGYDYTCKRFSQAGNCELEMTSQDDPCSYTAAVVIQYKTIMQRLPRSLTGRFWNDDHKAPYFVYMDGKTYHQVWYDDPESISIKSTFLKKLKLGGIGVMNLNDMDHSGTARATLHAEEMWNALCPP